MTITLEHMYDLTGLMLVIFSLYTLTDRQHKTKYGTALFWMIYAVTFLFGKLLPAWLIGLLVVLMAVIASLKWTGSGSYKESSAETKLAEAKRFGNKLFLPALVVPVVIFLVAGFTKLGALIGLGIGSIAGLAAALLMTRESAGAAANEGRRLIDAIGWAVILSQFLAALGALFDKAGVGKVVAEMVAAIVPTDSLVAVVAAYCIGMALFTMVMGNAFAAFAVITTGIGIPLVVELHGANPAIAGVLAMLAGYCGTLLTPMAANFNVVPAALLEMKDQYGVIKAQAPVALSLLAIQIALICWLAF